MSPEEVKATRKRYYDALRPLFFIELPFKYDPINYFASLLRVVGWEDQGWDPLLESRAMLDDLEAVAQMELPIERFPDPERTAWRMTLVHYAHIVEMDAPYEIITNLLRFRLGKGYDPSAFFDFLPEKKQKRFRHSGVYPKEKIEIISRLSSQLGNDLGPIFAEFFDPKLRRAIGHSDFTLTDTELRVRNGAGRYDPYTIKLDRLNEIIAKAHIFYRTFFEIDRNVREAWGSTSGRILPYDPVYKGLIEILVDDENLMCGFKLYWPNGATSMYKRTSGGTEMMNCMLDMNNKTVQFMVGLYAQRPGTFSPLVERDGEPVYANRSNGKELLWPGDGIP